eukprot:jgi/Mesvir1/26929/Mv20656-RA.2
MVDQDTSPLAPLIHFHVSNMSTLAANAGYCILWTLFSIHVAACPDQNIQGIICQLDISGLSDGNYAPPSLDYPASVSANGSDNCPGHLPCGSDVVVGVDPRQLLASAIIAARWQARNVLGGAGCETESSSQDDGAGAGAAGSGNTHTITPSMSVPSVDKNSSGSELIAPTARGDAGTQVASLAWVASGEALSAAYWMPAARAYPLRVLRDYQVINDKMEFLPRPGLGRDPLVVHFAVTFFYLSGTAVLFATGICSANSINCEATRLRASPLVYQGGLMLESWVDEREDEAGNAAHRSLPDSRQSVYYGYSDQQKGTPAGQGDAAGHYSYRGYRQGSDYRNGTSGTGRRNDTGLRLHPARPLVWSQMLRCVLGGQGRGRGSGGSEDCTSCGAQLDMLPTVHAPWGLWRQLHADTRVVTSASAGPVNKCATLSACQAPEPADLFQTSPHLAFASRFDAKEQPFSAFAHHPKAPTFVLPLGAVTKAMGSGLGRTGCVGDGTGAPSSGSGDAAAANGEGAGWESEGIDGTGGVTGCGSTVDEWALLFPLEDILRISAQAGLGARQESLLAVNASLGVRAIAVLNLQPAIFGNMSTPPMVVTATQWFGNGTGGGNKGQVEDFHGSTLVVAAFSSTLDLAPSNATASDKSRRHDPVLDPSADQLNGMDAPPSAFPGEPPASTAVSREQVPDPTVNETEGDMRSTVLAFFPCDGDVGTASAVWNGGSDGSQSPDVPGGDLRADRDGREPQPSCADATYMRDTQTGSLWDMLRGVAVQGPLAGRSLLPLPAFTSHWHAASATFDHYAVLNPDAVIASLMARVMAGAAPGDPGAPPAGQPPVIMWLPGSSFQAVDLLSWHLHARDRWQPWMIAFLTVAVVMLLAPAPVLYLFYGHDPRRAHRRVVLLAWAIVTVAAGVGGWRCYEGRLVEDQIGQDRDAAMAVLLLGGGTYWLSAVALMGISMWLCQHSANRGIYLSMRKSSTGSLEIDQGPTESHHYRTASGKWIPAGGPFLPTVTTDDVLASVTIDMSHPPVAPLPLSATKAVGPAQNTGWTTGFNTRLDTGFNTGHSEDRDPRRRVRSARIRPKAAHGHAHGHYVKGSRSLDKASRSHAKSGHSPVKRCPLLTRPQRDAPKHQARETLLAGASQMSAIFGTVSPLMMRGKFADEGPPHEADEASSTAGSTSRRYLWRGDAEAERQHGSRWKAPADQGTAAVLEVPPRRLASVASDGEKCGNGSGESLHGSSDGGSASPSHHGAPRGTVGSKTAVVGLPLPWASSHEREVLESPPGQALAWLALQQGGREGEGDGGEERGIGMDVSCEGQGPAMSRKSTQGAGQGGGVGGCNGRAGMSQAGVTAGGSSAAALQGKSLAGLPFSSSDCGKRFAEGRGGKQREIFGAKEWARWDVAMGGGVTNLHDGGSYREDVEEGGGDDQEVDDVSLSVPRQQVELQRQQVPFLNRK